MQKEQPGSTGDRTDEEKHCDILCMMILKG